MRLAIIFIASPVLLTDGKTGSTGTAGRKAESLSTLAELDIPVQLFASSTADIAFKKARSFKTQVLFTITDHVMLID